MEGVVSDRRKRGRDDAPPTEWRRANPPYGGPHRANLGERRSGEERRKRKGFAWNRSMYNNETPDHAGLLPVRTGLDRRGEVL